MLLDIQKLPTSANSAILLHAKDDVAVARVNIPAGSRLDLGPARVIAVEKQGARPQVDRLLVVPGEVMVEPGEEQLLDFGVALRTRRGVERP